MPDTIHTRFAIQQPGGGLHLRRGRKWGLLRLYLVGMVLIVAAFSCYEVAYGSAMLNSPPLSQPFGFAQGKHGERGGARGEVRTGRIAFAAYRYHNWDIYTVNPDGSDLRRVTHDPAPDRSPAWSPDGTRIAFASRRNHNWDVYVVDAGGGEPRRLTTDPDYDGAPSFSPDGGRIAFES